MTKAELVRAVAEAGALTLRDAGLIVSLSLQCMAEGLGRGDRIEIRGFGSFRTRNRPARSSRDPRNGALVEVPAKRVVKYRPGKELRAALRTLARAEQVTEEARGGGPN
jgi:integration host factor subunit beta